MLFLEAPMAVLSGRTIVLDPGRGEVCEGESDPGAVNPRLHLQERDAVRRQADLVRAGLQALGASVKILENGTTKSLRELGAEGKGCDCFVSLHLTAFNNQARSTKDVDQWLQQSAEGITAGVKSFLAS
jgi:N-acetylmuramoyl-L-alanine amidase